MQTEGPTRTMTLKKLSMILSSQKWSLPIDTVLSCQIPIPVSAIPCKLLLLVLCIYSFIILCVARQAKNRWLVAYTLIQNPSLVALTATNLQQTQSEKVTSKSVDHSSHSLSIRSNQRLGSASSPSGSQLSPDGDIHQSHTSIHDSEVEDTFDGRACDDSDSAARPPLVVTADSSRISEPTSEATGDCQVTDLTKEDSCEPKLELNIETETNSSWID